MKIKKISFTAIWSILLFLSAATAFAQTTAFSYQGRLNEMGSPVSGTRYFRFTLFDENGAAIPGATVEQTLTVTNGVFNTSLDFGAANFPGANRSLQISVKINAGDAYTVLNPRQDILAAPYSIKSKTADNAAQLGGVDATRFVQQDAGGNVSIAGNFTVNGSLSLNTVNAQTQYNLGGQRILGNAGNGNLFAGIGAGAVNTTGYDNAFFGQGAGQANTTGYENSFFGKSAGLRNTSGIQNSFFGLNAGINNTTGSFNIFIGAAAGTANQTGNNNTFVGYYAGLNNAASNNSFFGHLTGRDNTTGANNAFFGTQAGLRNTTGVDNTFIGTAAGISNETGSSNTFVGRFAGQNNTTSGNSFFGASAGRANTTGANNSFFGINVGFSNTDGVFNSFFGNNTGSNNTSGGLNNFFGGSAGFANTTGSSNSFYGDRAGQDNVSGNNNAFFGNFAGSVNTTGSRNTVIGTLANVGANNLNFASAFGSGAVVNSSDTIVLGKIAGTYNSVARPADTVQIPGNLNITGNLTGGGIVKSVNGLTNNVALAAGANITITPTGNTLTIASTGGGTNVILNQTTPQANANFNVDGNGTVGGTLTANKIQAADSGFVLGNFGIGTAAPKAKLDVTGGNILIDSPGKGIILKSPDANTCRLMTIDDAGAIALTPIACP